MKEQHKIIEHRASWNMYELRPFFYDVCSCGFKTGFSRLPRVSEELGKTHVQRANNSEEAQ